MKVDELPADIFVLPVTLIAYSLVEKVGHAILFDRLCTNMLLPLKSNREIWKTGSTVQAISLVGFLNKKFIVKFVKMT